MSVAENINSENQNSEVEHIPTFSKISHLYHVVSIDEVILLSTEALCILIYIRALRQMGKTCFANNEFLAKSFNCSKGTIGRALAELETKGRIERQFKNGRRVLIEVPVVRELVIKSDQGGYSDLSRVIKSDQGGDQNCVGGYSDLIRGVIKSDHHKNNIIKKDLIKKEEEREEHPSGAVASLPRPSASDFDFSSAIAVPSGVQEQLTNPAFVSDDLDFIFPASWTGRGQQSLRLLIDTRTAQGKPGSKESYQGFVDSFANNELGFESFVNCQVRPRVISEMETTTEGAGLSKTETVGVAETNSVNLQAMVAEAVRVQFEKAALSHVPAITGSETRTPTLQGQEGAKMEPTEAAPPVVSKPKAPKAPKAARPPLLPLDQDLPEEETKAVLEQLNEWLPSLGIKPEFETREFLEAVGTWVCARRKKYLQRLDFFKDAPPTFNAVKQQLTSIQKEAYCDALITVQKAGTFGYKNLEFRGVRGQAKQQKRDINDTSWHDQLAELLAMED